MNSVDQPDQEAVDKERRADTKETAEPENPYDDLTIAPGAVVEPGTTLVNKTGSWREERPVIHHEPCVGCGICVTYCPDNAVKRIDDLPMPFGVIPDRAPVSRAGKHIGEPQVAIDYDYCKGCGICANECPLGVIDMIPEVR